MDELADLAATAFARRPADLVSLGDLVERAARGEGVSRSLTEGAADEQAGQYLPYFGMRVAFDDARARFRLGDALRPPPMAECFGHLVAYAQAARWGKRRLSRQEARSVRLQRSVAPAGGRA